MRPVRSAPDLGATIRGRRRELGRSQGAVAADAGVSRQWLSEVEAGKATAEVGLVLAVLEVLAVDLVPVARDGGLSDLTTDAVPTVDLDELLDDYRNR